MHAAMHIIIFGFVCRVSDPQDMAIWGKTRVSSIFGVLSEGNSEWPVNFDLHGYTMIYSLGDLRPWSLIPMSGWWFQILFIFHNIWDNPSHWLTFFKMVKTTNQLTAVCFYFGRWSHEILEKLGWTESASLLERGDVFPLKWYTGIPSGNQIRLAGNSRKKCGFNLDVSPIPHCVFFHLKMWLFKRVDEPPPWFCQCTIAWIIMNYHNLSTLSFPISTCWLQPLPESRSMLACLVRFYCPGIISTRIASGHMWITKSQRAAIGTLLDSESRLERGQPGWKRAVSV